MLLERSWLGGLDGHGGSDSLGVEIKPLRDAKPPRMSGSWPWRQER
jgi:hypothetical protein